MTKTHALGWGLLGALLAGQAAHWYVGGAYAEHTPLRNALVLVQLAVGLGLAVYGWRSGRSTASTEAATR